jgi:RNA polymerase sigma-70 factor (ECF subfamily)
VDRIQEDSDVLEERIQKMKQVIDSLPPKCKEIIMLNKIQGVKYKDIAEQMGISVKTVESQMRIAFTKIREAFKEDPALLFILLK